MKKYKICPSCQTKNPPALFECINCEADLTGVKLTDEETEVIPPEVVTIVPAFKLVRICECGTKNAPNARKCSVCHEDISDITPTQDTEEEKKDPTRFVLSSLDGQYAYTVNDKEVTIGRENVMREYLTAKMYVSRSHARLSINQDELYIENLSGTNFTYVNNQKITEKAKLQDGDEIGLGGTNMDGKCQSQAAYFLVRIGQCM